MRPHTAGLGYLHAQGGDRRVPRLRVNIQRSAALHREAAALAEAAGQALERYAPQAAPAHEYAEQHELAARLRAVAGGLAPDWLGAPLDAFPSSSPLRADALPSAEAPQPRVL